MSRASGRWILKLAAWLVFLPIVLFAAWIGINATDEELSAEARALIAAPPLPAPSERNGFIDFLALGAVEGAPTHEVALSRLRELNSPKHSRNPFPLPGVKIDQRVPQCRSVQSPCLEEAAAQPELMKLIDAHEVFLRRYRAMRDKPQFVDLTDPGSPDYEVPGYRELFEGSRLALLAAAVRFNAGDRMGAVEELEKEAAFHRRIAAGSANLLQKMVAFALLDRDAWFIAEVARKIPAGSNPLWGRLEVLVREPTRSELDLVPAYRREIAWTLTWMRTRSSVRLPDAYYEMAKTVPGLGRTERPWWDPVTPYLYRPHQSMNLVAAKAHVMLRGADLTASELFRRKAAMADEVAALEPGPLHRIVLNPAGYDHGYFTGWGIDYFIRAHAASGVQSLVRLLIRLRAGGIHAPDDVQAALAGPLGRAHPDPLTGAPMRFDPATKTIGFNAETRHVSGASRALLDRYGRIAQPI